MRIAVRKLMLVCLAGLGVSAPALAHAACTGGGTLTGGYSVLVAGNSLKSKTVTTVGGKYVAGVLKFDGQCGLTGTISGGLNAVVGTVNVTGSYFTKPDGTISLTMSPAPGSPTQQSFVLGYSVTRSKAVGIEMDGSATATIDIQAQQSSGGYTDASLKGTYASTCNGLASSKDDLNYFTFDGAGNLAGANPFDRDGSMGIAHVTGHYSVNADGTYQGVLNGGFSIFSFHGVISNKLNEIQYVYNQTSPNLGEIVACTGTK